MLDEDLLGGGLCIERVIGSGSMAVLLQAHDARLERSVAVKLLHPKHMSNHEVAVRFLEEGRAVAALKSPHLPEVHRFGSTESGQPYIVMDLLEGCDLATLLERPGRIEVADAARYVRHACAGLAVAHAAGIVHRDVKPSNLFLCEQDGLPIVKVLDFGIAQHAAGVIAEADEPPPSRIVMGTCQYMSPEQIRSCEQVDGRADVWALGVVLFELLTKQLPFTGDSAHAILHAVLHEPAPRLATLYGDVPEVLSEVIERCLAKSPCDRYADVRELADALLLLEVSDHPSLRGPVFTAATRPDRASCPISAETRAGVLAEEDDPIPVRSDVESLGGDSTDPRLGDDYEVA